MKKLLSIIGICLFLFGNSLVFAETVECEDLNEKAKLSENFYTVDLHAPFSTDNLCCRTVKTVKDEDSVFEYKKVNLDWIAACIQKSWQVIQPMKIAKKGEGVFFRIIQAYLQPLFKFVFTIGVLFSVIMIIVWGIKVIAAWDDTQAVTDAHNKIISGIIGIVMFALSGFILHMINPIFFTFT